MKDYNGFTGAQRTRALAWLNKEYAAGRRQRPAGCDACGQTEGFFQAHSEDYSGPPFGDNIGRFGLCYLCHMFIHCRFRSPSAWARYVALVRTGRMGPNPAKADFGRIQRMLGGKSGWGPGDWLPSPRGAGPSFLDTLAG